MMELLGILRTGLDLLIIVLGFSLIIVLHELGHFVAARWAGIRVLAFAVGFGSAIATYRQGIGVRAGSTEKEYERLKSEGRAEGVSPTEYRLNVLPLGGYVKMLGQDDADPGARSDAADSFQSVPVWKRMIVISAGVVANLVSAAALFVVVFMIGLKTEPPQIGGVVPGSPAAVTVAENAGELGIERPGLRAGDDVLRIGSREPDSFNDLVMASATARRGSEIEVVVSRSGYAEPLVFRVEPRRDPVTRLMHIGVTPAASDRLFDGRRGGVRERVREELAAIGLGELEPGMRLLRVNGEPVETAHALSDAARASGGEDVEAVFADDEGREITVRIGVRPEYQREGFFVERDRIVPASHLLGLMPVMSVQHIEAERSAETGLRPGDVFMQLGNLEWPSVPSGVAEVRRQAGDSIRVVVARPAEGGGDGVVVYEEVDLGQVSVSRGGTIGFNLADTAESDTRIARWPSLERVRMNEEEAPAPSGSALGLPPGARVVSIGGVAVRDFASMREALRRAVERAPGVNGERVVSLEIELPLVAAGALRGEGPRETVEWTLGEDEVEQLRAMGWASRLDPALFEPRQVLLVADGPIDAIVMGVRETHRVMMSVYLTIARLFEGTVRVEHLRGPVGIAHIGTIIADRGLVWVMFFMALISVNLAVINFLPLPIVDGGHFLFLCYEAITGRPVSPVVQNFVGLIGLVLIVTLFVVVTYHDVMNLFTG